MIEYELTNLQLNQVNRFKTIFNKTHNQFVLSCIGLVVMMWEKYGRDIERYRGIEPEFNTENVPYAIEIPSDLQEVFYNYCDEWIYDYDECVNGIIEFVLVYLDGVWSGEIEDGKESLTYGVDITDMTDIEKKELFYKTNSEEDVFNEYFV